MNAPDALDRTVHGPRSFRARALLRRTAPAASVAGAVLPGRECSEADAFVAASLSPFSLPSRPVFPVVGPRVDPKLIPMQTGVFGRRFAARFAPATFRVAVTAGVAVGWVLL